MKVKLIQIGNTEDNYIQTGVDTYTARLKHYAKLELITIPHLKGTKNISRDEQKKKEGKLLLTKIENSDFVVLLDERGQEFNSVGFSKFLQKRMNSGVSVTFVIGGPFGFSDELYQRANSKIALSQMTFSHQMVRLFFIEQLYGGGLPS